ncbi:hypothetical protein Agabi119p4_8441 [Agaricus bisporus var. burnettii]|uniref:Uncharacterized protein n=1 Tax=Agaricus bisporus var. burnettii TaxID=192524 RepID=A0A8H7EZ00_AGABI|nr:hypothetical protein Agabi119p4_8441 [Agaricus bisporus var. burnettii]
MQSKVRAAAASTPARMPGSVMTLSLSCDVILHSQTDDQRKLNGGNPPGKVCPVVRDSLDPRQISCCLTTQIK